MAPRAIWRALHIKHAVRDIRVLTTGRNLADFQVDRFAVMVLERLFEIISEASRHLPADWRNEFGADIPWHEIASLGNIIRHGYEAVDIAILWKIQKDDLAALEAAIDRMISANPLPPAPV